MLKSTFKLTLMGVAALAIAAMPLNAAEKAEKADKAKKEEAAPAKSKADAAGQAIPFKGTLTAKTDASITIKERTFEVTSETKIMKNGKPATLADGVVGEEVAGQYRNADGKLVAKMIRFGAKPEATAKDAKKAAPKADKPEAKPEGGAKKQ